MAKAWPYGDFNEYLEALMRNAGLRDRAELSRVTGVSQTQLTNWRKGTHQPSRDSLAKIAPTLGVPPVNLLIAAGLHSEKDLDLSGEVDLSVQPREIRDLVQLYNSDGLTDADRDYLRRHVGMLVHGMRAELASREQLVAATPRGRRRGAA